MQQYEVQIDTWQRATTAPLNLGSEVHQVPSTFLVSSVCPRLGVDSYNSLHLVTRMNQGEDYQDETRSECDVYRRTFLVTNILE